MLAEEYLQTNYSKITNALYKGQEFSDIEIVTKVFTYLYRVDDTFKRYIDGVLPDIKTVKEKIHILYTKDNGICEKGNKKNYYKDDFAFRFCGRMCECAKEARIKTNIEKYGVENPQQNKEIKAKMQNTMIERYGAKTTLESEILKERYQKTLVANYGVDNPLKSAAIRSKMVNPFTMDEVKDKIKVRNQSKYGVENPSQVNFSDLAKNVLKDKSSFVTFMADKSIKSASEILGVDFSTICNYYKKFNIDLPKSSYETEITLWLETLGFSFKTNDRKIIPPSELDFYIPDHNLAIEFNGLYWHSDKHVSSDYHKKKYEACATKGIRLLMINEDEWITKKESIKRKILNICGLSEKSVGARKLNVRKIGKEANHFVDAYHIQGKSTAVFASYGAFYEDELVAVMQFNKQRGTGIVELVRFCTDGKIYAGVFSKLFKAAIINEEWIEVISFADLRYSDGNLYERNGFEKIDVIPPDYRYVKKETTYHKSNFTKARIAEKFGLDMSTLTESQAMQQLGYRKIYDCGKIKYRWVS